VFINPGRTPEQPEPTPQEWGDRTTNRPAEYNTLDDKYARVIVDELMPVILGQYTVSRDPAMHGIGGSSSGAIAAFPVAWQRPDAFRKVLSNVGSFVNLRGGHKYADKVLVQKDGATDWEATARNAEQARQHLERRLGAGDMPPAAATDYKLTIPEAFAEKVKAEDLSKDQGFQDFSKSLHAAGLSQKQYDMVVAEFLDRGEKMRHGIEAMDNAACVGALKQLPGWQSDTDYKAQMDKAVAAAKAYGGANFEAILTDYGNDPRICQLLAAVGAEVSEDQQASPEQTAATVQSLDTLMASKAYMNDRDPMHATVVAQVTALQQKVAGNRPVVGGRSMSFQT
jgi:hypothetical protein